MLFETNSILQIITMAVVECSSSFASFSTFSQNDALAPRKPRVTLLLFNIYFDETVNLHFLFLKYIFRGTKFLKS